MSLRRLDAAAYTVGWICALPVELAAAQVMLDEKHQPHDGPSSAPYTLGRIGNHNVVLVCLPAGQMGIGAAAFSAGQAMSKFTSIRFGLMVGIGGGAPSADADVRLGDVVISQPFRQHSGVIQYDFGKAGLGGQLTRTGSLNAPPQALLHAVTQMRAHHYQDRQDAGSLATHLPAFDQLSDFSREKAGPDVLFEAAYHHNGGTTCENCSRDRMVQRETRTAKEEIVIHYGTIASGNQVIKDGATRDRLSEELGGVLCFEMEAAGLMNDFPCLVVRGICDYADSHKNKSWQPYAAATAAACAKAVLSFIPATEVVETIAPVKKSSKYRVPFSLKGVPIAKFSERPRDTEKLEQVLLPHGGVYERRLLVLYGLGGMGKTQLAANFARRYQNTFSAVLWLDGSSVSSLKQSFASFASRLPVGQISEASRLYATGQGGDIDAVVRDVLGWLSMAENSDWLLIVDNVDRDHQRREVDAEAYDVEEYLPEADQGSVLITTRLQRLSQLGEQWKAGKVDKEQAQAIFEAWYGRHVGEPLNIAVATVIDRHADELLDLVDGLPLALAQAAAYMNETGIGFDDYTRLYKAQWRSLMEPQDGKRMPLRGYANGSVATTWMISYTAITEENKAAANLLLLWAHLDNKSLWHGLLAVASEESDLVAEQTAAWLGNMARSEIEFNAAIRLLRSYCLVEETGNQADFSTHPVVHQWALHMQGDEDQSALSQLAFLLVGLAADNNGSNFWEAQVRLLPHVQRCVKSKKGYVSNLEAWDGAKKQEEAHLWAFNNLGILYCELGKLDEAEKLSLQALEGKKKALGEDHTSTLDTVNNLGLIYTDQGKLDRAEEMLMQVLEGRKKTFGEDHRSTFETINNLGILYSKQGKLDKAEIMFVQALEGKKKVIGKDHKSTLHTFNNLGLIYTDQGKLDRAEEMLMQALEGYKKGFGEHHKLTLLVVNHLGSVYKAQKKLGEAEDMYMQALKCHSRASVDNGTTFLDTMSNLGSLYSDQGKLDDAEKIYLQALEGYKRTLGDDHMGTLALISKLGTLYSKQGKLGLAEELLKQALEGYKKAVSPDAISTFSPALGTMWVLAALLHHQQQLRDARQLYFQALAGYQQIFGDDHTYCQGLRAALASLEPEEDFDSADAGGASQLTCHQTEIVEDSGAQCHMPSGSNEGQSRKRKRNLDHQHE